MESQHLIERYEYKYLIPEAMVPAVRATATATSKLDPYSGPDGTYRIRSLYFDSDTYHLYWANEREASDRFKMRIRGYPLAPKAPVFLEIKRRVHDVILKTRGGIPVNQWQDVVRSPNGASLVPLPPNVKKAAERFLRLLYTYHLRPMLLVEYEREAYVSLIDNYARLTFDRKIVCQKHERLDLDADPRRWRSVDHPVQTQTHEPVCVLELKFEHTPPRWMRNLVERLDLMRFSFSKYCYGVNSQLLLPTVRVAPFARGSFT